jgi:hypothetical protein
MPPLPLPAFLKRSAVWLHGCMSNVCPVCSGRCLRAAGHCQAGTAICQGSGRVLPTFKGKDLIPSHCSDVQVFPDHVTETVTATVSLPCRTTWMLRPKSCPTQPLQCTQASACDCRSTLCSCRPRLRICLGKSPHPGPELLTNYIMYDTALHGEVSIRC